MVGGVALCCALCPELFCLAMDDFLLKTSQGQRTAQRHVSFSQSVREPFVVAQETSCLHALPAGRFLSLPSGHFRLGCASCALSSAWERPTTRRGGRASGPFACAIVASVPVFGRVDWRFGAPLGEQKMLTPASDGLRAAAQMRPRCPI